MSSKRINSRDKSNFFTSPVFSCLRNLKHDTRIVGDDRRVCVCPLCKLSVSMTYNHFELERQENVKRRLHSLTKRSEMRLNILLDWSRLQSSFYNDVLETKTLEVAFSKSFAETITSLSEYQVEQIKSDKSITSIEIMKLIQRRQRIKEVGEAAAIFLQSVIRKYICMLNTRRKLLRRFTYVPPTKKKQEFFVDEEKLQKWTRYPHLVSKERPATPKTIQRRLEAEERSRKSRAKRWSVALSRTINHKFVEKVDDFDLFPLDTAMLTVLRQFVIFRDVVALAMHKLTAARIEKQIEDKLKQEKKAKVKSEDIKDVDYYNNGLDPVWFSISSPSSGARELGISMVLDSVSPQISTDNEEEVKGLKVGTSKPNAVLNKNLQVLEQHIWQSLQCKEPEELLGKLLNEDLNPVLHSVMNLATDEKAIYDSSITHKHSLMDIWEGKREDGKKTPAQRKAEEAKRARLKRQQQLDSDSGSDDKEDSESHLKPTKKTQWTAEELLPYITLSNVDKFSREVLPLSLELHSSFSNTDPNYHNPNGLFRLFFYKEDLVGVTQLSPWCFYPEVAKYKDNIVNSLLAYTNSKGIKSFITSYHNRITEVNKRYNEFNSDKSHNKGTRTLLSSVKKGTALYHSSMFVPSDEMIFNLTMKESSNVSLNFATLSYEDLSKFSDKYPFLKRLPKFMFLLQKARRNFARSSKALQRKLPSHLLQKQSKSLEDEAEMKEKIATNVDGVKLDGALVYKFLKNETLKEIGDERMQVTGSNGGDQKDLPTPLDLYAGKLRKYGSSDTVKTDLSTRINLELLRAPVSELNDVKVASVEEKKILFKQQDLFVVDLHVRIPKPVLRRQANAASDKDSTSALLEKHKAKEAIFPVELHQVIGLFSLDADNPPPLLSNMGLFDWPYFTKGQRLNFKGCNTSESKAHKEKTWSYPNSKNSVSSYSFINSNNRDFSMRILGTELSVERMENVIPTKIKQWIGMKVENN